MKLRNAMALAKRKKFKWIAVDKDCKIWAFTMRPKIYKNGWLQTVDDNLNYTQVGVYNGNKEWYETLREVI